ncbi:uncharacterized protein LOC100183453 [Ciona intestinalis]
MMKQEVQVTPQQNLLSTIYRQSWYPVASSTKENRKKSHERESHRNAGNLRRDGSPFQKLRPTTTTRANHKSIDDVRAYPNHLNSNYLPNGHKASRSVEVRSQNSIVSPTNAEWCMNNTPPSETDIIFENDCVAPTDQPHHTSPTLASWRRRLRTCVQSRSKLDSQTRINKEVHNISSSPCSNVSLASRQHSWTNVTAAKSYRAVNYPNHTLAAMCLQGTAPSVQQRPTSRAEKRTRCVSNPPSIDPKYFSGHIESNELCKSDFLELQNEHYHCVSNDNTSEHLNMEIEKESPDFELHTHCESETEDQMDSGDDKTCSADYKHGDTCENELETQVFTAASSDYDSDLSDTEISSNIEDESTSISSDDGINQQRRCDKYKQLYMNENQPTICHDPETEDTALGCCNEVIEFSSEEEVFEDEYLFSEVLPAAFDEVTLHELSMLPFDSDWKAVVSVADSFPLAQKKIGKRKTTKAAVARRERIMQQRGDVEAVIDRLLSFEKLQAVTAQNELQRKLHSAHLRSKTKHSVTKSLSAQSDSKISDSNNSAVKNIWARRRSSIPNFNARLAWATEARLNEDSMLNRACKDGDLTILHNNWLACCKDRAQGKSESKRADPSSQKSCDQVASSNVKRPKSARNRVGYYEYHLSERSKDEKRRRYSNAANTSSVICSLCRERARRILSMKYPSKGTLDTRQRTTSTPRPQTSSNSQMLDKCTPTATARPATVRSPPVIPSPGSTLSPKPATANPAVVTPLLWKTCNDKAKRSTRTLAKEYTSAAQNSTTKFSRTQLRSPRPPVNGLVHLLSSAVKISAVSVLNEKRN